MFHLMSVKSDPLTCVIPSKDGRVYTHFHPGQHAGAPMVLTPGDSGYSDRAFFHGELLPALTGRGEWRLRRQ